jgi:nucleolar protein 4
LVLEWYKIELGEMLEKAKKDLKNMREKKAKAAEPVDSDKEEEEPKAKKEEQKSKADAALTEEDLEGRVRKIESGLQERQDGMRGGRTLLVEFSIENVQVSSHNPFV